MKKTEIIKTLEKLKKLPYENIDNELRKYSVKTLELLAGNIYKNHYKLKRFDLLKKILYERCKKLNKSFEWTNENQQKLLNVNDKIMQTFELTYDEALSAANELENRIKNNDQFVKDYEIEIKIDTYINDQLYIDNGENIGYILSEPLSGFSPISYSFGHSHYSNILNEKPIYLDKDFNWNISHFGNIFNDKYICYGIQELLNTHEWSFNDVVNISRIWSDVVITRQYYIDLI